MNRRYYARKYIEIPGNQDAIKDENQDLIIDHARLNSASVPRKVRDALPYFKHVTFHHADEQFIKTGLEITAAQFGLSDSEQLILYGYYLANPSEPRGRVENEHLGFRYVGFDTWDDKAGCYFHVIIELSKAQEYLDRNPRSEISRAYEADKHQRSWAKSWYASPTGPKIIKEIGVGAIGDTIIWRVS